MAAEDVAVGPQASPFAGVIAASLPAGARVLAPEEGFTSLLFPFLAQEARGVEVRLVPLERIAEAVDAGTDLVAFSAVQSSDGRLAPLDALVAAAAHHGARTFADATQACGWLPLDAGRFDFVVCAGCKWLLAPRGTAFLYAAAAARESLLPHLAGWYAAEAPMANLYGGPLRLAASAKALDVSPAWMSWVGQAPALELLERVGIEAVHAHDLALAGGDGGERGGSAHYGAEADRLCGKRRLPTLSAHSFASRALLDPNRHAGPSPPYPAPLPVARALVGSFR